MKKIFKSVVLLVELTILLNVQRAHSNKLKPIHLISFLDNIENDPWSYQRVAESTVNFINNETDLLAGYQLTLLQGNPVCTSKKEIVISYLQLLYGVREEESTSSGTPFSKDIVGMIGPHCSNSQVQVLASLNNRAQISFPHIHLSMLPSLGDRVAYANSYGIIGSSLDLADTAVALIRAYSWNVSILYQDKDLLFQKTFQHIFNKVRKHVQFASQVSSQYLPLEAVSGGMVVVLAKAPLVTLVLCEAYKKGMMYRDYQWMLLGAEYKELISSLQGEAECYMKALEAIQKTTLLVSFATNCTGGDKFLQKHGILKNNTDKVCLTKQNPSFVFDSVWAFALALNKTLSNEFCNSLPSCIRSQLAGVSFSGLSGHISFNRETGFNKRTVNIYQLSNTTPNLVGNFHNGTLRVSVGFHFPRPSVEYAAIRIEVAILFTLITFILLSMIASVHILTVRYRHHPCIRASNYKLSHLVFIGCYATAATEFVFLWPLKVAALPDIQATTCLILNAWMFPVSLSLIFAPLIAHIWRLYRIYTHFTNPGCWISNTALGIIIAVLLGVDVLIGTLWSVLTPTYLVYIDKGAVNERGVQQVTTVCTQSYPFWYCLMFVYKFCQLSMLMALCLLTQNVGINRNFTTGRFKVASYLIILTAAILIPIYFLLYLTNAEIHADVAVMCILTNIFLLLCNTFILLPPVLWALKEKRQRNHHSCEAHKE